MMMMMYSTAHGARYQTLRIKDDFHNACVLCPSLPAKTLDERYSFQWVEVVEMILSLEMMRVGIRFGSKLKPNCTLEFLGMESEEFYL